jgi:hypothetical protein
MNFNGIFLKLKVSTKYRSEKEKNNNIWIHLQKRRLHKYFTNFVNRVCMSSRASLN